MRIIHPVTRIDIGTGALLCKVFATANSLAHGETNYSFTWIMHGSALGCMLYEVLISTGCFVIACPSLEKKRKVYAVRRHDGSLCTQKQPETVPLYVYLSSLQTALMGKYTNYKQLNETQKDTETGAVLSIQTTKLPGHRIWCRYLMSQ